MLSLAWSPDGSVVASGCQDNNVHVWRFPQGKDTVLPGTPLKPRAAQLEQRQPAAATTDGPDVMVWSFAGEAPMPPLPVRLVGPPSLTTAVAFGPGGTLLATGYRNGMVHVWTAARARSDGRRAAARRADRGAGVGPARARTGRCCSPPRPAAGSLAVVGDRSAPAARRRPPSYGRAGAARSGELPDAVPPQAALEPARAMSSATRRRPSPLPRGPFPSPRAWSRNRSSGRS